MEPPADVPLQSEKREPQLIMLSARDADELRDIANRMSRYLQQNPLTQLGDIAYTLQQRSQKGQIRWAKVAATTSQLQIALDELSKTKQLAPASNEQLPRVAFVFTNDEEWDSDFASDLLARSNNYRQICESAEQLAAAHGTFNDAEIALFANQFATAEMLRQLGIAPDVICGYGTGDYAAACISGAITFSDAVDLLRHRTTLLKSLNLRTIHVRVAAKSDSLERALAAHVSRYSIAAVIAAEELIISVQQDHLDEIRAALADARIDYRVTTISKPHHSQFVVPATETMNRFHEAMPAEPAWITCCHTPDGAWAGWGNHWQSPIRLDHGLAMLRQKSPNLIIQIGPNSRLEERLHSELPESQCYRVLETGGQNWEKILQILGKLYECGLNPTWEPRRSNSERKLDLPTRSFRRQSFWVTPNPPHINSSMPLVRAPSMRLRHPLLDECLGEGVASENGQAAAR
jgi:acyl transferase domain-containing protein